MLKKVELHLEDIRNKYIHETSMKQKHVAILMFKNGEYVCHGVNGLLLLEGDCSEHAEFVTMIKYKKTKLHTKAERRKKFMMLVARLTKSGQFAESRPCTKCIERLVKSGIKIDRIYYTTRFRTLQMEKLYEMEKSDKNIYSTGYRYKKKIRGHEM